MDNGCQAAATDCIDLAGVDVYTIISGTSGCLRMTGH